MPKLTRLYRLNTALVFNQDQRTVVIPVEDLELLLGLVGLAEDVADAIGPSSEPYEADNVCPEYEIQALREVLAKFREEATDA